MRTIYLSILVIALGIAGLSLSTAAAQPAPADASPAADASPVAGSGSAVAAPVVAPPAQTETLLSQLGELKARYEALKSNSDKSAKMLLWAALIAAGLKILLSLANLAAGKKPSKWLAWIALVLAVPIALLSYFAAGNSLFDSLVYAGAGPGAIVLHELLKVFAKPKAEATA